MKQETREAIANYITTVRTSDIISDIEEVSEEIDAGTTTTQDVESLLDIFEEMMCERISQRHSEPFVSLRERLASVQHTIWSHWMRYFFTQCDSFSCEDGVYRYTIPKEKTDRWKRQMDTLYDDLSDKEQESDRHQADKIIQTLFPFYPMTDEVMSDEPGKLLAGRVDSLTQFLIDELHYGMRLDFTDIQMLFKYTLARLKREVVQQQKEDV